MMASQAFALLTETGTGKTRRLFLMKFWRRWRGHRALFSLIGRKSQRSAALQGNLPDSGLFFPRGIARIGAAIMVRLGLGRLWSPPRPEGEKMNKELVRFLKEEWFLGISLATVLIFSLDGKALFDGLPDPVGFTLIFVWLFAVVLGSCLHVVRHADGLAEIVGEPYGTLILTLSVTTIEVASISAVMLDGASNHPTLVRDTLFAVVMIILGGMAGVCLSGWRLAAQGTGLQSAGRQCLSGHHHPSGVVLTPGAAEFHRRPRRGLRFPRRRRYFCHFDVGRPLCRFPGDPDRPASRLFPPPSISDENATGRRHGA